MDLIKGGFSYFTTPILPENYSMLEKEAVQNSKPYKILYDVSSIEQMKENLPGLSGYLLLQVSEDKQSLYVAYSQVSKERKFQYYVSKMPLGEDKRNELKSMVERLATLKTTMQKTPITIEEDLEALEKESEQEISSIIEQLEVFFKPVTSAINEMMHPVLAEGSALETASQ